MNIKTHVTSKRRDLCLRFLLHIKTINYNYKKIQIIGGRHKCAALFKELDFFHLRNHGHQLGLENHVN